jgi:hypothetical protein
MNGPSDSATLKRNSYLFKVFLIIERINEMCLNLTYPKRKHTYKKIIDLNKVHLTTNPIYCVVKANKLHEPQFPQLQMEIVNIVFMIIR